MSTGHPVCAVLASLIDNDNATKATMSGMSWLCGNHVARAPLKAGDDHNLTVLEVYLTDYTPYRIT